MVVQFISNLIILNNCPEMSQDHKDFFKKAVKIKKKKNWFWISEIDRKELKSCEKLSTSHYSVAWRNIFSSNNLTFSFSARLYQFFILLWRNFLPLQFIEFRYSSLEVLLQHFSWVGVWTLTGSLKSLCSCCLAHCPVVWPNFCHALSVRHMSSHLTCEIHGQLMVFLKVLTVMVPSPRLQNKAKTSPFHHRS